MKKKTNRRTQEVSYWESMADSMIALLLCILLVMLLLMLYLIRIEDNQMLDEQLGFSYEKYDDPDQGGGNHGYGQIDDEYGDAYDRDSDDFDYGGGGGYGGGGSYGGEGDEDYEYEDPDPGAGEGEGSNRAAVLVQVMDGETDRTIKKEGIAFELYDRDALLQVLNTYYPKKVSYKQYKTDSSGVFYLPERLRVEKYYLHCLTAVSGYDTGEDTYFEIDQSYDWEDPYVVNVRLYPSKNAIELQCKDLADGKPIPGATFQVIAAENITTADGTLRYQEGSVVDNITTDASGSGRSKNLFLGSYLLRQSGVPEYYGKLEKETPVTLKAQTSGKHQEAVEVFEEKTSMEVTAVDELYVTKPLAGLQFSLCAPDGTVLQKFTTDAQGRFTATNLKKNTAYTLRQENTLAGYVATEGNLTFRVDSDGHIDGLVNAAAKVTNRTLRLSIAVQDRLFRGMVSDVNLALMDAEGRVVKVWTSSGLEQTIEGLTAGEYKLIVSGNQESGIPLVVEDTAELQQLRVDRWTTADIAAIAAAAAVLASGIAFGIWLHKNKKRNAERT